MNWIKADVTPGEKNTEIKPGTTDEKIGQEFKESEEHKALGAPEGDQKEPSTGVKENPEVHKDPEEKRQQALQMGANIVQHAFTN